MLAAFFISLLVQPNLSNEAPQIMAALTYETVEIREDFNGTELVLFGATRGLTLQDEIVVVLAGPQRDLRVMRKERRFGIWMNTSPVEFRDAPSYYAIASSRQLVDIADMDALREDSIGLVASLTPETDLDPEENSKYLDAIVRAAESDDLFLQADYGVDIKDGGLFQATIILPPLTPVGEYNGVVYLFRDGQRIAQRPFSLQVEKAGLERVLYEFAHQAPIIYGLFCVALAMLAGWAAAAIFGRN